MPQWFSSFRISLPRGSVIGIPTICEGKESTKLFAVLNNRRQPTTVTPAARDRGRWLRINFSWNVKFDKSSLPGRREKWDSIVYSKNRFIPTRRFVAVLYVELIFFISTVVNVQSAWTIKGFSLENPIKCIVLCRNRDFPRCWLFFVIFYRDGFSTQRVIYCGKEFFAFLWFLACKDFFYVTSDFLVIS